MGRRAVVYPYHASKKQTLESVWYNPAERTVVAGRVASKKQTLESVWYTGGRTAASERGLASKKQTLESVWYRSSRSGGGASDTRLKEADARKRLVPAPSRRPRPSLLCASKKQTLESVWYVRGGGRSLTKPNPPQRSRRSKASGT